MTQVWKVALENLRLQIADELDVLKEVPVFSWYENELPDFVRRMIGLRSLSCPNVKSRDIPKRFSIFPRLTQLNLQTRIFQMGGQFGQLPQVA